MSEYGRLWEHQRSLIEIARQKLKHRPALVTVRDVDEEIARLTRIRAEMVEAEQRMRDGDGNPG